jgi:hypothetical protein
MHPFFLSENRPLNPPKSHQRHPKKPFLTLQKPPKDQDFSSQWYNPGGVGGMDGMVGTNCFSTCTLVTSISNKNRQYCRPDPISILGHVAISNHTDQYSSHHDSEKAIRIIPSLQYSCGPLRRASFRPPFGHQ